MNAHSNQQFQLCENCLSFALYIHTFVCFVFGSTFNTFLFVLVYLLVFFSSFFACLLGLGIRMCAEMIFDQIFTGIIKAKYHFDDGSSIGIFVSTLKYNIPIYSFGLKNLLDVLLRIYC